VFAKFTSLALAAATNRNYTIGRISEFLGNVQGKRPVQIFQRDAPVFLDLFINAEHFAKLRREQLLDAGVDGKLGAIAISDELTLLDSHDGGPFDHYTICTRRGFKLLANPDNNTFEIDIDPLSRRIAQGYYEPWKESLIATLPAQITHTVEAYDVPAKIWRNTEIPNDQFTTVGTLGERGYVPYAKVLESGLELY